MSISIATLKEALHIKESIQQLEARLARILGGESPTAEIASSPAPGKRGRRKMSAAARAKISAAQKARWAAQGAKGPKEAKSNPAKTAGTKRGRKLSPEGRARIVAALKARWARQKGTKTAPAPAAKKARKKTKLSAEGRARIVAALKKRWASYKKK